MSPWWIAAVAAGGLAAGPAQRTLVFATAVPSGQPRRHCCPGCGERVIHGRRWFLSAAWVTGRCPGCGSLLGVRPLVPELVTAAAFALLAARTRSIPVLAALCLLAAMGIALAFIDAAVRRLPDMLTMPLYAAVTGLLAVAAAAGHQWGALLRAVLAGVTLAGFYLILLIFVPAGMGPGDAKLALAVGTMAGWYGWPALFAGTFYAFLGSGAYALALLAIHRATGKDSFAFAPFMIGGAILGILTTPV